MRESCAKARQGYMFLFHAFFSILTLNRTLQPHFFISFPTRVSRFTLSTFGFFSFTFSCLVSSSIAKRAETSSQHSIQKPMLFAALYLHCSYFVLCSISLLMQYTLYTLTRIHKCTRSIHLIYRIVSYRIISHWVSCHTMPCHAIVCRSQDRRNERKELCCYTVYIVTTVCEERKRGNGDKAWSLCAYNVM